MNGGDRITSEIEGVIWIGTIGLACIVGTITAIRTMKKSKQYGKSLFLSTVLNALIILFGSIWWWNNASDGISQYFGVLFYWIAFIIIGVSNVIILHIMKKRL